MRSVRGGAEKGDKFVSGACILNRERGPHYR